MAIELNADLGEGGQHDVELLRLVQRANVCLGVHAGSPELTEMTGGLCAEAGVQFCAHPGYPDRESFGRRSIGAAGLAIDSIRSSVFHQVKPWVGRMTSLKPHGAFYNDSQDHGPVFDLLVELLSFAEVPLVGMRGTAHQEAATVAGVALIAEGFADRGYMVGGRLIPRTDPHAFVSLEYLPEHLDQLVKEVRSICVHGDGENAVMRLEAVRAWLNEQGIEVAAWTA